jgi:hypothetical protein
VCGEQQSRVKLKLYPHPSHMHNAASGIPDKDPLN